jgi:predicted nucleotidyltransferase
MTLDLDPLVSLLRERVSGLAAVYLFGSAARAETRPDSDLDLAILLAPGADLPSEQKLDLTADLGSRAGRTVDLSVLARPGGAVLGKEVVTTGRRLWDDGTQTAAEFEMYALSAYARLREDRAPVEAAYSLVSHG